MAPYNPEPPCTNRNCQDYDPLQSWCVCLLALSPLCLPVPISLPICRPFSAICLLPRRPAPLTNGMLTYTSMRWCCAPQVLVTTRRHAAVGSISSRGVPLLRARVLPADVALPSGGRVLLGNRGFSQCIRYRSILGCHWRYVPLSLYETCSCMHVYARVSLSLSVPGLLVYAREKGMGGAFGCGVRV